VTVGRKLRADGRERPASTVRVRKHSVKSQEMNVDPGSVQNVGHDVETESSPGSIPVQSLRLKRFAMAAFTSFLFAALVSVLAVQGFISKVVLVQVLSWVGLAVLGFFLAFYYGLNRLAPDPSLTIPQIVASALAVLYVMYEADAVRGALASVLGMILLFGVFRYVTRSLLILAGALLSGYALVIALAWRFKPESFDASVDFASFLVMAVALPWFAWIGGHIRPLREQHKQNEANMRQMAHFDPLTGLANRDLLKDRLRQAIANAARHGQGTWVVFIDIDRFKAVNDSLGHKAGDEALRSIATRLKSVTRNTDTVARYAGNEFVLVLPEGPEGILTAGIVQRFMSAITKPFMLGEHEIFLTCSAGIAVYPSDGKDAGELIEHADIAMNRAKENGRNVFHFYTPALNELARKRLRMESDLRHALERNEFVLHYQPQVDLRTHQVIGMEALVRWQHPEFGMIMPTQFIELAEDMGLIVPLGDWVLRMACQQTRSWQRELQTRLCVAVNLSARQFLEPDLVESIAAILASTGLAPADLEIELTEGLLMADVEAGIKLMDGLKKIGVSLSIDDFGTGYSSLAYLKRFPVDILKIDRSFVRDIATDANDAAIVASIVSLAGNLKLRVVSEGVETQEQLDCLRSSGCHVMQGYYFSRPLPVPAFSELLERFNARDPVRSFGSDHPQAAVRSA